jgi:hypothetical protein
LPVNEACTSVGAGNEGEGPELTLFDEHLHLISGSQWHVPDSGLHQLPERWLAQSWLPHNSAEATTKTKAADVTKRIMGTVFLLKSVVY